MAPVNFTTLVTLSGDKYLPNIASYAYSNIASSFL